MTTDKNHYELTPEEEADLAAHLLGIASLGAMNDRGLPSSEDFWLIPGMVASTNTFLYGQSKAGKSYLVAQIVRAVATGEKLLGKSPVRSGVKTLIVTTDAGSRIEYQDRLNKLKVPGDAVFILEAGVGLGEEDWIDLQTFIEGAGVGLAVFDHATDLVEGEINQREGWRELWHRIAGMGEGVARILVGHATDSKHEGKPIKRPMGNAAATQYARARINLFAPGGIDIPLRELELVSNNAGAEKLVCRVNGDGFLELDAETTGKQAEAAPRNRSAKKIKVEDLIRQLALSPNAPRGTQAEVRAWIAQQPGVVKDDGERFTDRTIKDKLDRSDLWWDREQQRYFGHAN